jgi:hypothetical protein
MIPKSMSLTPIGDGYRFSDKIMPKEKEKATASSLRSVPTSDP